MIFQSIILAPSLKYSVIFGRYNIRYNIIFGRRVYPIILALPEPTSLSSRTIQITIEVQIK